MEDIGKALEAFNETFDISRPDLDLLLREIELRARVRRHGHIICADVMSKDVIKVSSTEIAEHARFLLLKHDIRMLPVTDPAHDRVVGTIGLRS